jgi:hypothetical protein
MVSRHLANQPCAAKTAIAECFMFEWREEKLFYEMVKARCIPKLYAVYFIR